MVAAIAQDLHLSIDERDHVFHLAGQYPPLRGTASERVGPGMLRIPDRLSDAPTGMICELGEALRRSPLGKALTGDASALVRAESRIPVVHRPCRSRAVPGGRADCAVPRVRSWPSRTRRNAGTRLPCRGHGRRTEGQPAFPCGDLDGAGSGEAKPVEVEDDVEVRVGR